MKINIFDKEHHIPDEIINYRDLNTQFPIQSYEIWLKFIKPGDVVLDIGAYIGLISLHFAALGAKVHAFEGSSRNSVRLKKLTEHMPHYKIYLHEVALSNEKKECFARFNDCVDREHPKQKINYVKYDDYAIENNIENPTFVKMDIEGMETVALKEMNRLIYEVRPVWQIECHTGIPFKYLDYPGYVSVDDGGFDFQEFERTGYLVFDEQKRKIKIKEMKCFENYFFIPMKTL